MCANVDNLPRMLIIQVLMWHKNELLMNLAPLCMFIRYKTIKPTIDYDLHTT